LRHVDNREIEALGLDPFSALSNSVSVTENPVALISDDEVTAIFGCSTSVDDQGVVIGGIWMLASERIYDVRRVFTSDAPRWLDILTAGCQRSGNVVDCRSTASIRWLRRMGYSFGRRFHIGRHQFIDFYKFHV
tara:strand:- start:3192 stop:3593 length:402 start_codon:yes stop_codon:yes gene_type:complete